MAIMDVYVNTSVEDDMSCPWKWHELSLLYVNYNITTFLFIT